MKTKTLCITIFLLFTISMYAFEDAAAQSYPPLPEALAALESTIFVRVETVKVADWGEQENYYYAFEPRFRKPKVGFIIYPGAFVDPRSYAPAAHAIAQKGFLAVIVKMPQDLAVLAPARANEVIAAYENVKQWAIGGHSMGGAFACSYAKDFTDKVDGVVLWAAYPSEVFSLADKDLNVISIYGTNDGLATVDEIEDSRQDLPPDTDFVEITGGNHTYFGWYGDDDDFIQPEDNPADISRKRQQKIIICNTAKFLKDIARSRLCFAGE